jgi:LysM repeat protein
MKAHSKVVLLVAVILLLAVSACTRQAAPRTATVPPTAAGEVEFPFTTPVEGAVAEFGTQTAAARTPQVIIATETPVPQEGQTGTEGQGGVVVEIATPQPEESGGGIEPVAPVEIAVATPVVERPASYTLQNGEWPICIARRYDVDMSALLSANGMNMNSKPSAGTTLRIPASGSWNPAHGNRALMAHPVNYTVPAGETIYRIACKFGDVTPEGILAVNGLASAADLQAGATILIP